MNETTLNGQSADILFENIKKLKQIFPEVFCEDNNHLGDDYLKIIRQRLGTVRSEIIIAIENQRGTGKD